jgi:hypothetical protein
MAPMPTGTFGALRTPRRDPSANITGDIYWRIDDTSSSSIAIVDRYFIETLGLLPEDPDWELIGRDWVKPRQMDARARLHGTLIRRWLSAGLT